MKTIFGKKLGMTQLFTEERTVVPATVIEIHPATIVQIKNIETDGYEAVQVGFDTAKEKKSQKGKLFRTLREIRLKNKEEMKTGDVLDVSLFVKGEKVTVTGISKGKGFQGGVKRHGFHGKSASHGVKHEHRTLGSVGSQQPQRVIKGKKMPGHTGARQVTVKNLKVADINAEKHLIALEGAVPGARGTLIRIQEQL